MKLPTLRKSIISNDLFCKKYYENLIGDIRGGYRWGHATLIIKGMRRGAMFYGGR